MPVLSICIPTYNRCEYLMNNLQHICEHQEYDFEIIISDNASTDDTYKRVTEYIKNNNIDKQIAEHDTLIKADNKAYMKKANKIKLSKNSKEVYHFLL